MLCDVCGDRMDENVGQVTADTQMCGDCCRKYQPDEPTEEAEAIPITEVVEADHEYPF